MATLRVKGQSVATLNEKRNTVAMGHQFLSIVEKAQRVGYLDDQIAKMIRWLDANKGHPKWGQREAKRYRLSCERNALVAECQDHGATFSRLFRELTDTAIEEIGKALDVDFTTDAGSQVAMIARKCWDLNMDMVIDRWSRDHYERTAHERTEAA